MSDNNFIKKILGVAVFAAGFVNHLPAQGSNWINLSGNELFEYQVNVDAENTNGDIWTAPLKATTAGVDLGYGKLSINCKNRTVKLQLHEASSGWDEWGEKDFRFANGICTRAFPKTYNHFTLQNPSQRPILNAIQNDSVVIGKKCSYVSVGGSSPKSCE